MLGIAPGYVFLRYWSECLLPCSPAANGSGALLIASSIRPKRLNVQRTFRIAPEASFALSVKNPEAGAPPGVGLGDEQKPDFPKKLHAEFRDRPLRARGREDARL
jgi:hypothetical protein